MTEISERYARLADAFATKVAAVPAARWDAPSPCDGWDARDVVRHVIDTQGLFLGLIGKSLGDIPSVDDDPAAAWDATRAVMLAALEDPAVAQTEYDGFSGRSTLEAGVDRFLSFDLVIHAWDLARATGLDETMDPSDVTRVRAAAEAFGPVRSPQVFGPEVDAPPGANEQEQLLAFLGRRP